MKKSTQVIIELRPQLPKEILTHFLSKLIIQFHYIYILRQLNHKIAKKIRIFIFPSFDGRKIEEREMGT
jgi:hypothetical protein